MKAWKIVAAVVAVLVIGFVAFVLTFDIGKYKGAIEAQAKAATGREVAIGSIRMGLSLTPTIVLTDVSVANAPGGSRPQMIIMKSVSAQVELLPLLSNQVNVNKITMDGPDILRIRAFPFPDSVLDFITSHEQVFVIEQNRDAQFRSLLVNELNVDPAHLMPVLHYDGTPITARFIIKEIGERVRALNVEPIKKKGRAA